MTPEITCCFTGHRPQRLPWGDNEADLRCQAVKARLTRAVAEAYDRGYRHFLCGMAQGADLYFCQAVLHLKAQHPGVTLEAAIPYEGQADHWPPADRLRRQHLLNQCDLETVVQHHYTKGCMLRRNRAMADAAALLVTVYDGGPGGTEATIRYARQKGKQILPLWY